MDMLNASNYTPLQEAAKVDSVACAEILLKNGADVARFDELGRMAIHTASALDSLGVMNAILDHFPDQIDMCDHNFNAPLHVACKITRTSRSDTRTTRSDGAAKLLIERGCNIYLEEDQNLQAMHLAAASGMTTTCRLLVAYGASVDVVTKNGSTALLIACQRNITSSIH